MHDTHTDQGTVATETCTIETRDSSPKQAPKETQVHTLAIPKTYPRRLALDGDELHLNALHCFIRRSLLEIFIVEPRKNVANVTPATNSSAGRVGLRCVHCAAARQTDIHGKNEATMAVFYPRAIAEIYRLVTSWQRCHLRKCRNLPPSVRTAWRGLKEGEKSRGKTSHWVDSAKAIGLVDCTSKAGGIRFCLPCS
jgi:hypothetical protein